MKLGTIIFVFNLEILILEYLGGIETKITQNVEDKIWKILEYLGGIETQLRWKS